MRITEVDGGRALTITVGEDLEVTLDANPTTGYQWETTEVDLGVLSAGPTRFVPANPAIGSGGTEVLAYRAKAAGQTKLMLSLLRPFERAKLPAKEFSLMVTVIEPRPEQSN